MSIRQLTSLFSGIIFIAAGACSKDDPKPPVDDTMPATVAFNEINATGNPDWIELYNYGEEDVDLQGFVVYDREEAKYTLPSGYIMEPGDFLILICDDQGVDLNMPFKLTSLGETITIQSPGGQVLDRVTFPAMENGQTYARFPDGSGAWAVTGFETKNKTNGNGPVSFFKSYSYTPEIPMVGDDVSFSLEISDGANIASIQLLYAVDDGSYQTINMTSGNNTNYSGIIPALSSDGELDFYFKLTDNSGNVVLLPEDALDDPNDLTITSGDVPNLVINEFMASNSATFADPFGEFDDWIEIYNPGATAVDMGRFYFSDSEDPFDDRIPGDAPGETTIQPGGYLIFWADSDTEQGPNHLKFRLSASGESISLYYKDGRLIDTRTFGTQTTDVSEGRSPDGSSNWVKFNTPTPGASNQ